jgi:type II secretory pathway pseudopilin PulG
MSNSWKPGPTILGALLGMGLIAAALAYIVPQRDRVQKDAEARASMRTLVNALNVYVEPHGDYPNSLRKLSGVDIRMPKGYNLDRPTTKSSYVYIFAGSCLNGLRSGHFKHDWDPEQYWVLSTAASGVSSGMITQNLESPDARFEYQTVRTSSSLHLSAFMDGRIQPAPLNNEFSNQCLAYNSGSRRSNP